MQVHAPMVVALGEGERHRRGGGTALVEVSLCGIVMCHDDVPW